MLIHKSFPVRFPGANVTKFTPLSDPLSAREMDLNRIASFLSRNLYELNPFLQKIKGALKTDFRLEWDQQKGRIRSFELAVSLARMMESMGLLHNLDLKLSRFTVQLVASQETADFLSSRWLEQALRTDLVSMHPTFGALNVHVEFDNGASAVLSALAAWDNQQFWFESATEDIDVRLRKFDILHWSLGIPSGNCLVVTPDIGLPPHPSPRVCRIGDLPVLIGRQLPQYRAVPGMDWRNPNRVAFVRMHYPG